MFAEIFSKRELASSLALAILCLSCADPTPEPPVLRLTDLFATATVTGQLVDPPEISPTEWRFDDASAGWKVGQGVTDLAVVGGVLRGRTTSEFPVIHVEREADPQASDVLHSVEIRLRLTRGTRIEMAFMGTEEVNIRWVAGIVFGWPLTTPVVADEEMRTYVLKPDTAIHANTVRHVLLRPGDANDAEFEIESIRLVFRREHLAGVPSGLGWHGLAGIYRETLVTRAPEALSYPLTLPSRPRLDLELGKIEDVPVTFRVEIEGSDAGPLFERKITTTERWETARIDLTPFAGRDVTLKLSTDAPAGTIAFWGSPVVRNLGALPVLTSLATVEDESPPQGVILIITDTLRPDHLEAYGYERETAPVLSRLAAEGVLFKDCVAQGTWTKVSVPTILTSIYPTSHGVHDFADRLPSSAETIAEVFREAGYATLSLSSIVFTGKFTNLHQGFEVLHESTSLVGERPIKSSWQYVRRLLPWLDAHREVPFFVVLHVADPHDPFEPNLPYDTMWAQPDGKEVYERQRRQVKPYIRDPLMRNYGIPTRAELLAAQIDPESFAAHEIDWYDGSIRGMDTEIGRLIAHLKKLGLDRTTLVAVVSDHGEEFLEHGRHFHGQSVYGELAQVPWILWGASVPAGRVVEETVETLDVMPTVLDFAGLALPGGMQGESLRELIAGRDPRRRPAVTVKAVVTHSAGPPPRSTASAAIIDEGWKLIHNSPKSPEQPEFELYDHKKDPLDRVDVASEHPDVVARLAERLEAWRVYALANQLPPDDEVEELLSAEELERLRSLGYIN